MLFLRVHWDRWLYAKKLIRGAGEGIRTPDPLITNQMLYQLSYAGVLCVFFDIRKNTE